MTSKLHLPDFLIGKHRRYKADTNRLATFLAQTAHRLGYTDDIGQAPAPAATAEAQPKSARLKGKARKAAASANSAAAPTAAKSVPNHGPVTVVSTKQFVDLATYIADRDPRVRIPNAVLTWARRAIRARRQCAEWFLPKDSAPTADAPGSLGVAADPKTEMVNQAHWHFIHVLTKVVEILAPLVTVATAADGKSPSAENVQGPADGASVAANRAIDKGDGQGIELLESRFAVLSVDDTADMPDEVEDDDQDADQEVDMDALVLYTAGAAAADQGPSGKGNKKQQQQTYRVEDDDGEVLLSLFCFFNDIDRVRTFLKETWTQYRDGTLDLVTASLVTSTAMDLVRQAQADLLAFHPRLDDYLKVTNVLYLHACLMRGLPPSPLDPADIVNPGMWDVAEFLMLPVHSLLDSLGKVLQPGQLPAYRKGHLGTYDPLVDRSSLSMRDRMQEDRLILMELMPEFVLFERIDNAPPVCDTLSEEFNKFARTKAETPIMVFATQVFLDIHEIMRENIGRGLQDLQATGVSILSSIDLYNQHKHRASSVNWPATNEFAIQRLREDIDFWVMHDPYVGVKQKIYRDHMRYGAGPDAMRVWQEATNNIQEFALLKQHPWMCGLLQFRYLLAAHDAGQTLADNWGTILYTGHLYEAGKIGGWIKYDQDAATGHRIGNWADMEFVMAAHKKEKMFRGRIPDTPLESLNSLQLMMGASGVDLVGLLRGNGRNKKGGGKGKSRMKTGNAGPVGLSDATPVCSVFRERFLYKERPEVSMASVEALITSMVEEQMLAADAPKTRTSPASASDEYVDDTEPLSYLQQKWHKSHSLTPLQVLSALRAVLAREHDRLRFNYMRMHIRCTQALRDLHQEIDERMVRYVGPGYCPSEEQLAWLAAWVILISFSTDNVSQYVKSPAAAKAVARRTTKPGDDAAAADIKIHYEVTGDKGDEGEQVEAEIGKRKGVLDGVQIGSRILRDASNVVQKWIDAEGDVECKAMDALHAKYIERAQRPRPALRNPTQLWAWQNASFNGRLHPRAVANSTPVPAVSRPAGQVQHRPAGGNEHEWRRRQALMEHMLQVMDEQGLEFNPDRFEEMFRQGDGSNLFTPEEIRAMMVAQQQRRQFAQLQHNVVHGGAARGGRLYRRG
ncbi:hypothetical protein BCR44DRAFT_1461660 [Catenaria anguillulae PL171]|uniref:DUF6604 domain-containing protein n=1 Tax=Catenaria anguillulae PL171 TaxID=765915 RepID=A0A1Y2HJM8_9FUNG|nr:hypothetical protein BCR44DRAFT_1461660 [Catenaria anguillulae PL171]